MHLVFHGRELDVEISPFELLDGPQKNLGSNKSDYATDDQDRRRFDDNADADFFGIVTYLHVRSVGLWNKFIVIHVLLIHVSLPALLQNRNRSPASGHACPGSNRKRTTRCHPWQWDTPRTSLHPAT